jgi:antitoxin component of MazEF toxin-antitoxin module
MPTIRRIFQSGNSRVVALPDHALEHIGHQPGEPVWVALATHPTLGPIIAILAPTKKRPPPT